MKNYRYKDEIGNIYGSFRVIEKTNERVPSNGCVIWKCECIRCGKIAYKNGNYLRFANGPKACICTKRRHKRK